MGKFAENFEFCEKNSLLFKIIHFTPHSLTARVAGRGRVRGATALWFGTSPEPQGREFYLRDAAGSFVPQSPPTLRFLISIVSTFVSTSLSSNQQPSVFQFQILLVHFFRDIFREIGTFVKED